MTDLCRVNVAWQNWPGAPGLSQFYFLNSGMQTSVDALRTFYNALSTMLPTGLTIQVPGTGDIINDADGKIVNSWTVTTPPTVVTASGTGTYAGNAGAVVHWLTSGVINGRRIRGRTFLVPLISTQFESNGSLSATALSSIGTAASALRTSVGANFRVWRRPVLAHTKYDPKTGQPTQVAAVAGSNSDVVNHRIPDLAISLRSRRI